MIRLIIAEGIKNRNTMKKNINIYAGINLCFNFVLLQIIMMGFYNA